MEWQSELHNIGECMRRVARVAHIDSLIFPRSYFLSSQGIVLDVVDDLQSAL